MTWVPQKKTTVVDKFQVRAGMFDTELEASENADSTERPKFRRFAVSVDSFKCSDCGREHTAEMSPEVKDESGAVTKAAAPVEPEPCDHTVDESGKPFKLDPGPKNPWE